MNIGIIGLGLIGGSISKALKENTAHRILGYDKDEVVLQKALEQKAIDEIIGLEELDRLDVCFICLHPELTIEFIRDHAQHFAKASIVCDVCGVKKDIVDLSEDMLIKQGVIYVGTHPMAGREYSGFDYSDSTIFHHASFIITPTDQTPAAAVETVKSLAIAMKFDPITLIDPVQHDRNIAFTSQLAHIVSNAYVKSPSLTNEKGFSAGSFHDLTRVAKLNEDLWTSLFMHNRDFLLEELSLLMTNLADYKKALANKDDEALCCLLKEGRLLKEKSLLQDQTKDL